jgi:hypothetical protein
MLCQRLSNPSVFSLICPKYKYQIVASRIVGMEEVRDESEEAKAAGYDNELIFCSKLLEEFLLIFLELLVNFYVMYRTE